MTSAKLVFGFAVVAGLGLLTWSADRFVTGASGLARGFGVSPLIIGLTIVAFGTSAPEMLVSAMAAWQGNSGIAIGNAVGSNLFNLLAVLGIAGALGPGGFDEALLTRDFPLMIGLAIALYFMARGPRNSGYGSIRRWEGAVLVAVFVAYQVWIFVSTAPAGAS